jgi:hypothetical protein
MGLIVGAKFGSLTPQFDLKPNGCSSRINAATACMDGGWLIQISCLTSLASRIIAVEQNLYSLDPFISIVVGVRAISLTRFIENTCNICSSK